METATYQQKAVNGVTTLVTSRCEATCGRWIGPYGTSKIRLCTWSVVDTQRGEILVVLPEPITSRGKMIKLYEWKLVLYKWNCTF